MNSLLSKPVDRNVCHGDGCLGGALKGTTQQQPAKGGRKRNNSMDKIDDTMLAQELNELSVEEREKVYEDIHGISSPLHETPELITKSLEELRKALSEVSRLKRKAYDRAVFLKPSLEHDHKFQLMFLRADRHDPMLAALRMCQYFTYKVELFGEDKIVKRITLEDMDDDDMKTISTGAIQVLPNKDQSGRAIFFAAHRYFSFKIWQNQIRYSWYQIMCSLEDEEAQLNGFVHIMYCLEMGDNTENFSPGLITKGGPMLKNLPFRIVCMHFCYNDVRIRPAMTLMQMVVGRDYRLRFRTHFGSNVEVQYELMTFGLPMKDIPLKEDGTVKKELNTVFLKHRREVEAAVAANENASPTVLCPNPNDVLLGRGRPYQAYCGNQALALIVDDNRERYNNASARYEKGPICTEVVKVIQSRGGRFLQRTQDGWITVSDEMACKKVSHGFRTTTNRQLQRQNNENLPLQSSKTAGTKAESKPNSPKFLGPENKRLRYDEELHAEWTEEAEIIF